MYAQLTILGYTGSDPKLKYLPDGTAVCNFSIASTKHWFDKAANEWREKTTWFQAACWGDLAKRVNERMVKGDVVFAVGEPGAHGWIDQDTQEARAALDLTVRRVKFFTKMPGESTQADNSADDAWMEDGESAPGSAANQPYPF